MPKLCYFLKIMLSVTEIMLLRFYTDFKENKDHQAPVVQKVDSAIQRINLYPVDSAIGFRNTYPLDRDLSGG